MAAYQQPYGGNALVPPPGWGQPPFQSTYGQLPSLQQHHSAPTPNAPPFKKQKGNPVITKYPPPPAGWKPPIQALGNQQSGAAYQPHQPATPVGGSYQLPQPAAPSLPSFPTPIPFLQPSYQTNPAQVYQQPPYQPNPSPAYQQPPSQSSQQYQPAQPYQATQPQIYQPPQQTYQASQQPYQPPQQPSYQPPQHQHQHQPYHAPQVYHPPQLPQPAQSYVAPAAAPYSQQPQHGYNDSNGAWQTQQPPQISATSLSATFSATAVPEEDVRTRQSSISCSLDLDFDGEAQSLTDPVDPRFSLGLIVWHPAKERNRPLPSTFEEAELEDLAPAKPSGDEEECISKYFVNSNKHEVELSIKQTDEWEEVKNDLIFVEFVETCEIVPLLSVIENRIRPTLLQVKTEIETSDGEATPANFDDLRIQSRQPSQPTSSKQIATESQKNSNGYDSDGDQAMEISEDEDAEPVKAAAQKPSVKFEAKKTFKPQPTIKQEFPDRPLPIRETLEKAWIPGDHKLNKPSRPPHSVRYSRSRSPEKMDRSRQSSQQLRQKPMPHPRDPTQESILAALGVEGSPTYVYPTPPPALGPPVSPDRARSPDRFGQPLNGMYHPLPISLPYGPSFPPPPPPPRETRSPSYNPWRAHEEREGNYRRDRSPSTSSQRTAAGSDFHPDGYLDLDATPKAKPPPPPPSQERSGGPDSGRKRTYDRMTEAENDKRRRQTDDTPRARRKPNYDRTDAYSRRW